MAPHRRFGDAAASDNEPVTESSDVQESRSRVRELLALLADPVAQRRYEVEVPIANVPAELICMWFDDHYHPGSSWFIEAFSPGEREVIADFNRVFDGIAQSLPTDRGVSALQSTPEWDTVCRAAAETLAALE
jgi:hypothetical protein